MNPRVSVILNCRNGADYLNQAVDSLLAQTHVDWELIAWDDGSTDETRFILNSYSDKRFRVFSSPATGSLRNVRSLAMQKCRGDWLAFLDQDDVWLPEKLAMQMELAKRYPLAGLIYGRAIRFRGKGAFREYDHRHEWSPLPEEQIFERLIVDSCFICMSSAMMRRSALAQIDPIPTHVRLTPDYYLYLALARQFAVRAVQQPVCFYREHSKSLTCQSGRELQFECVRLINQFSPWMAPDLARRRRRVHHSLIGFADLSHPRTFGRGLHHLLDEGCPRYLASRPFARCYRYIKRWFVQPYCKDERRNTDAVSVWRNLPDKATAGVTQPGVPARFGVLGTPISVTSFAGAEKFVAWMVEQRVPGYVCNANTYSVMYSRDVDRYRRVVSGAIYVTADGMPLVWMLRALGQPVERVHGDDLFFACCKHFPEWRHFLVGGRDGQSELAADELRRRYPGINIVGFKSTLTRPPSAEETASILQQITETRPSIIWVGMGTPSQDFWMSYAASLTGVPMAGVGSSFDILAGYTQPAPKWIKRHGLQWMFRMFQEPRRLGWRYLYNNSRFLLVAAFAAGKLLRHRGQVSRSDSLRTE